MPITPNPPRVALFADSFHEVNGVANTCRQFDAFARRRGLPFLSAHIGPQTIVKTEGAVTTVELARGPAAFPIERDMSFDPLLPRYRDHLAGILREFKPDIVHITGPSDIGMLGSWLAKKHRIPIVASWHTNLHEFGARRLERLISFVPQGLRDSVTGATDKTILFACGHFYRLGSVLLAPNDELVNMLVQRTGKPVFLMQRGVETDLFSPSRRTRTDDAFVYGYVGRITPEKNVRLLYDLERALLSVGETKFRIMVVGHGSETEWLQQNLRQADFPGVLKGERLAEAYANMDAFFFPSHTDTFGNVILEAAAAGVPSIVTSNGGPKFLVKDGESGFIARDDRHFVSLAAGMMKDRAAHDRMRSAARAYALTMSWDAVFEKVYDAYDLALSLENRASSVPA